MPVSPILGYAIPDNRRVGDFPFWGDHPELWDDIEIAGIRGWGLVTVIVRKHHNIDKRQTADHSAPTVVHMGFEPADITIQIRMWTQEHWDTWVKTAFLFQPVTKLTTVAPQRSSDFTGAGAGEAIARNGLTIGDPTPVTLPTGTAEPKPLSVAHPALMVHGIRDLYVTFVEPPRPSSVPGIFEAAIHAQEWKPKTKDVGDIVFKGSTDITSLPTNDPLATSPSARPSKKADKP